MRTPSFANRPGRAPGRTPGRRQSRAHARAASMAARASLGRGAALMALAVLGACADPSTSTAPDLLPVRRALTATSATSPFGWLAPLGTASADPSTFDATAAPVVEICAWTGTACASEPLVRFATTPVAPTRPLVVNAVGGWFEASWDLMDVRLTTRRTYRVQVRRGTSAVGAVLVDAVRGRWALTQSGTLAPLQAASTVPIRFRMDVAPVGGAITPERRTALVQGAAAEATRLEQQGARGSAFVAPLVAWLRARAEFEAAGTSATGGVWARFRDDRLLVIEAPHARPIGGAATVSAAAVRTATAAGAPGLVAAPPTASLTRGVRPVGPSTAVLAGTTALSASAAATSELPWSRQARLFHSFGTDPGVRAQIQVPIDEMRSWLGAANYDPLALPEGEATVEMLRTMKGDGLVQINAHGDKGVTRAGDTSYVMSSTTRVAPAKDVAYDDDLANKRLAYYVGDMGGAHREAVYAITAEFIRTYVELAEHAVVFLNVCWSANQAPDPRAFVGALHQKKASVVFGWTRAVDVTHAMSAVRYFLDRTLGANQYATVGGPPQRPFDWPAVIAEMQRTGRARDPNGAELTAMPRPGVPRNAGFLVPSIEMAMVCTRTVVEPCAMPGKPAGDLYIRGVFGPDPGAALRTVTIRDGTASRELPVVTWDSTLIVAQIPLTGVGSVGDLRVQTRGRISNPRRMHAWNGALNYTLQWYGSLQHTVTIGLRARFDPPWGRLTPDETPHDLAIAAQNVPLLSPQPSEVRWSASGTHVAEYDDCRATVTWNGGGRLPIGTGTVGAGGPSFYWYHGTLSADRRQARVALQLLLENAYTETVHEVCVVNGRVVEGTSVTKKPIRLPREFDADPSDPSGLNDLRFALDATMGIRSHAQTATTGPLDPFVPFGAAIRLQWGAMPATPAFDVRQPR